MKMKQVVIQLTVECPSNVDPLSKIRLLGGQDVKCTNMKITGEVDLGDTFPPYIQKKEEFTTVRHIIQSGLKAAIPELVLIVYGSRMGEGFNFWIDMRMKTKDYKKPVPPPHLRRMLSKLQGLHFTVHKGILTWMQNVYGGNKIATMSLGNPDIAKEIETFVRKLVT